MRMYSSQAKEMVGKKFNRLRVVSRTFNRYVPGSGGALEAQAMYECACDCGNTIITSGVNIRKGGTKSCGCLRRENNAFMKPFGVSARNAILRTYKKDAVKRGMTWSLSDAQFDSLTKGLCHYCGAEPTNKYTPSKQHRMNGLFSYNGIDRKDNASGYTEENCVSCCKHCNRAKRAMSYNDFISWLTRASTWIASKGK
jgi:hypothetical protein